MVVVGDEVVIMSAPGRFRVVSVEGDLLRISRLGAPARLIHVTAVRVLPPAVVSPADPAATH